MHKPILDMIHYHKINTSTDHEKLSRVFKEKLPKSEFLERKDMKRRKKLEKTYELKKGKYSFSLTIKIHDNCIEESACFYL